MKKLILGGLLTSLALLVTIPIAQTILSIFAEKASGSNNANVLWFGIIAETLRGFITTYLYQETKGAGKNLKHAIQFGLLTSLLVASLWVILGAKAYHAQEVTAFILKESFIMLVQGLFSGIALWAIYQKS